FKSDFIISLIEVTLNYHDGIDPVMRSIIDRCVREIYKAYLDNPCEENIPTFMDFYKILQQQKESQAKYLVSALEIYIEGSLNIFASKTNVNINNRLICFNTKGLGSQLKVMGMSIIQDFCWNHISKNQALNKNTWLWNDEVHHSLKNSCTAEWLINSWKRGRKYGLIATGMTQEVRDVCKTEDAKALIANSEFIILYRQQAVMIPDLAQVMSLSDKQVKKLLSCDKGTGLFKAGNSIIEFNNRFEEGTKLFDVFSTDIDNKKAG
ncbi:MAG TPA: conjugal transfer protein, partial [Clostridia bacterium]|nr:conjugal transfer protein [Clostridia bacterium]